VNWIAQPNDRTSLNGRPALLVRERNEIGQGEEAVVAVFMNRIQTAGLVPADAYARLIALAPRMAECIATLFEIGCEIAPEERTGALQEAMNIHEALTNERDRYGAGGGAEPGDVETGDAKAAA